MGGKICTKCYWLLLAVLSDYFSILYNVRTCTHNYLNFHIATYTTVTVCARTCICTKGNQLATMCTHLTGASSKQTTVAGDLYTHWCEDLPEFILSGLEAQVTHKHSPGLLRTLCLNLCCLHCWNLLTGQLYNASLCYNCACVCGCVWACVCVWVCVGMCVCGNV